MERGGNRGKNVSYDTVTGPGHKIMKTQVKKRDGGKKKKGI